MANARKVWTNDTMVHLNLMWAWTIDSISSSGFAFRLLCWGLSNLYALRQLRQDFTKECQCEMLERRWIFLGWVRVSLIKFSLLWSINFISCLKYYLLPFITLIILQKRHKFEPYYEILLQSSCWTTGKPSFYKALLLSI